MPKRIRIRRIFCNDYDGYFSFESKGVNEFLRWPYTRQYGFYTPVSPASQQRIRRLMQKYRPQFVPITSPFFEGMVVDYQVIGNLA